jgi:O-methyltransferase involved in polyketide biosynthesis
LDTSVIPGLTGVSETMLWTLHNRASEARRRNGILTDPDSIRIHAAMDYDFERHFGRPRGTLAARAAEIDRLLRDWLVHHPQGQVVSLGEGLESQRARVDNGRMQWLSVDLPAAIELREQFLPSCGRFRHIACSALSPDWLAAVDPATPLFIIAQGLLMYLPPAAVETLLRAIAARFPGAELAFDTIPRWFSRLTLRGFNQTPHYRLPPMPWGIDRDEIEATLARWHPALASARSRPYRAPRGLPHLIAGAVSHLPVFRHEVPSLVHLTIGPAGADGSEQVNRERPRPETRAFIGHQIANLNDQRLR